MKYQTFNIMSKINRNLILYLLLNVGFLWALIEWIMGYDSFYLSNPSESRTNSYMETYLLLYTINKFFGKVGTTVFLSLGCLYNLNKLYKAFETKRKEIKEKTK